MLKRSSGVLMHITSLPGKYGIGDFGNCAYEFVDFLIKSKQKLWQVLPLGGTGYGDSPYQSCSAFAGNPYFISLDEFLKKGLIKEEDLIILEKLNCHEGIDYSGLYIHRNTVLKKAYQNFKLTDEFSELEKMKIKYSNWLPEYALFMALKNKFNGISWQEWPRVYRVRDKKVLDEAKIELNDEINFYIFLEYFFRKQWRKLKSYANKNGIKIIGDIPIFVATDSADTWANPSMFQFDKKFRPKKIAGCPPDVFSVDGQLWGNVLYDWKVIKKENYSWWIDRIKDCFKLYDIVRIDHFRGFDSYWSIPAKNKTARIGKWETGPGIDLFRAIKKAVGNVDIIAEDLGFLTPRVRRLLEASGYPGMKILQFAFGTDETNEYLPTNVTKNSVIYTGTHDNQTLVGWYNTIGEDEKEFCHNYISKYLGKTVKEVEEDIVFAMIEAMWKSKAVFAIVPMQDLLKLDDSARMNTPSTLGNNWQWRLKTNPVTDELTEKLKELTIKYKR